MEEHEWWMQVSVSSNKHHFKRYFTEPSTFLTGIVMSLVRNISFPRPCSGDTLCAPGAVRDTGTEGKACFLSFLAPLVLPSYRLATAPYIPVSVPSNCFLLMVQGFPPALFVPEIKLTALGAPPLRSVSWLMFAAYCPILTKMHEKHPVLKRKTDSPALPCCLFFSHLKIPLEALDCFPAAGNSPLRPSERGAAIQSAKARHAEAAAMSQAPGNPLPVPGPRQQAGLEQFRIEVWMPIPDKLSP